MFFLLDMPTIHLPILLSDLLPLRYNIVIFILHLCEHNILFGWPPHIPFYSNLFICLLQII